MKKNKFNNNAGLTLIEILIGIVISAMMMGAMYTTYSVVNNSYSQVTDRAKISRAGRDIIGMLMSCLLYTSPSPRDKRQSRMPSSA